jgi:dimethylargininase
LGLGTAIVRRPSPRLAEGIVTHQERAEVDAGRALAQWEAYVAAMGDHGWRIVEAAAADDHPDGVFLEDAVVVLRGTAVLTRPGAPERRGEVDSLAPTLAGLGLEPRRITAPATLDGGDVMPARDSVYVGLTERTNAAGARQLGELLEPAGMTVVPVPLSRVLHLKSAATVLPDGTVIGYPAALDDPSLFPRFLAAPEEAGLMSCAWATAPC